MRAKDETIHVKDTWEAREINGNLRAFQRECLLYTNGNLRVSQRERHSYTNGNFRAFQREFRLYTNGNLRAFQKNAIHILMAT